MATHARGLLQNNSDGAEGPHLVLVLLLELFNNVFFAVKVSFGTLALFEHHGSVAAVLTVHLSHGACHLERVCERHEAIALVRDAALGHHTRLREEEEIR